MRANSDGTRARKDAGLLDMQNGPKPDLPKSSASSHLHRQHFTYLSPAPSLASPMRKAARRFPGPFKARAGLSIISGRKGPLNA